MTSHRITHLASGIMTERATADALRPFDILTLDVDSPDRVERQVIVAKVWGERRNGESLMHVIVHPVMDVATAHDIVVSPSMFVHRIVSAGR